MGGGAAGPAPAPHFRPPSDHAVECRTQLAPARADKEGTRCWHITFATPGRTLIVENEDACRRAVRCLGRLAGDRLVLFCFADDHVHVLVLCPSERLGWLERSLALGLSAACGARVVVTTRKEVEHRGHLESLVAYLLEQPRRHGLRVHPARWSGSSFFDLVGARRLPELTLGLFDLLPRWRPSRLFGLVELPVLQPASDGSVRAAGPARLARATSTAFGVDPGSRQRSKRVAGARRAGTQVAAAAGMGPRDIEWALGISGRSRRRFLADEPDPIAHRAVRLQIAIEDAVIQSRALSA